MPLPTESIKNTTEQMSRRDLLASAGLLASVMPLLTETATAAEGAGARNTDIVLETARIRARLDGRPAYWLARGIKYALSGFEMIPLHGFNMLAGIACSALPDGGQLFRMFEAPYATDLKTGEATNVFTNPLTDADIPIPHIQPLTLFYGLDQAGKVFIGPGDPRIGTAVEFDGSLQARQGIGSDVLLVERFVTRSPAPAGSSEKPVLSELINHIGLGPSLSEDGAYFAEARSSIVVLRNGLEGPEIDGYPPMLLALYEGQKFLSMDDAVRQTGEAQMERTHPGFLERLAKFA